MFQNTVGNIIIGTNNVRNVFVSKIKQKWVKISWLHVFAVKYKNVRIKIYRYRLRYPGVLHLQAMINKIIYLYSSVDV